MCPLGRVSVRTLSDPKVSPKTTSDSRIAAKTLSGSRIGANALSLSKYDATTKDNTYPCRDRWKLNYLHRRFFSRFIGL